MKITKRSPEKCLADSRKNRIPDVSVLPRHRSRLDLAGKAVAHHQVVARAQTIHKSFEAGEIVTVVRISHDDVLTARGLTCVIKSRAITTYRYVYYYCTCFRRDSLGSIRRSVIADHHLAVDSVARKEIKGLVKTRAQCLGFVQARHYNTQLNGRTVDILRLISHVFLLTQSA